MPNKYVLVVEGYPGDEFFIKKAFQEFPSCECRFCSSVSAARAFLFKCASPGSRERTPDALITELRFKGEFGRDLIAWIRGLERLRSIPIHVYAGAISPHDLESIRDLSISSFTEKRGGFENVKTDLERIVKQICG